MYIHLLIFITFHCHIQFFRFRFRRRTLPPQLDLILPLNRRFPGDWRCLSPGDNTSLYRHKGFVTALVLARRQFLPGNHLFLVSQNNKTAYLHAAPPSLALQLSSGVATLLYSAENAVPTLSLHGAASFGATASASSTCSLRRHPSPRRLSTKLKPRHYFPQTPRNFSPALLLFPGTAAPLQ